jgi:Flp pilus assembly protein TadG
MAMSSDPDVRGRGDRGAAAVEMALVLPILLLLVVGMLDFGITYNHWISLTNVAHEGARLAAVGPASPADVKALAATYGLDASKVSATIASSSSGSMGKGWTVTVTYPYDLTIPWWGTDGGVITATALMKDEQSP